MTLLVSSLAEDWDRALMIGRIALPEGPTPVLVRKGRLYDISEFAPTVSEALVRRADLNSCPGRDLGAIDSLRFATAWDGAPAADALTLLAPVDLQCVKASGVTFAVSALERVIEERAQGDARRARDIRDALKDTVGSDLSSVQPGSAQAADLKSALIREGLWSQYLEVAIGPDAGDLHQGTAAGCRRMRRVYRRAGRFPLEQSRAGSRSGVRCRRPRPRRDARQ